MKKYLSIILTFCMITVLLAGCSSQHVEVHYQDNDNENIQDWDGNSNSSDQQSEDVTTWDTADVTSWSEIDNYSNWVYSEILFDDITDEWPVVECQVLDYRDNGKYFDGEKVYELVNDKFDVNGFVAKYAVGTGVIVICVILNVATAGGSTPICCFIAGAAHGAVKEAVKGAAFGAAMKGVVNAIKSDGDLEQTLFGALEGSADGYMWGAIYGAVTGGWKSQYCFTGDTIVKTPFGETPIATIKEGDYVYSYDEKSGAYSYQRVTQTSVSKTESLVNVTIGDETISSTAGHPYLTDTGWVEAGSLKVGDKILSPRQEETKVIGTDTVLLSSPINVYGLCVDKNHSYIVGDSNLVVHNRCNINGKYAGKTYEFPEGSAQAKKYPKGVPFTQDGFPDFSGYAKKTVKFPYPDPKALANNTCLRGNCSSDFDMANKAAGLLETPAGYTWHHCEDAMTMQLVPQDLHNVSFGGVGHTGGESIIRSIIASIGG